MKVHGTAVRFVRRRPWVLAVSILAAAPFLTDVVDAAIPGNDGSVHACVNVYSGKIRIMDGAVPTTCGGADERELNWSSGRFLTGAAQPTGDVGSNGDMYLDTTHRVLYGPKTDDAWGSGANLVGPPVVSGLEITEMQATVGAGSSAGTAAVCPNGKRVVGGGAFLRFASGNGGGVDDVHVLASTPFGANQWYGAMQNKSANNQTMVVQAICASG